MKANPIIITAVLCLIASVQACLPTANSEVNVPIQPYYRNFIFEKKGITETDLTEQQGKTVLIHPILAESNSFNNTDEFFAALKKTVQEMDLYKKVVLLSEIDDRFDSEIREMYFKYIDTYRYSHISDREFTYNLREKYGVDTIIFFQIDAWPCELCINQNFVQMNFTMVDTYSGYNIWLAFDEEFTEDGRSDLTQVGDIVRQHLFNSFYLSFRKLPHIQYKKALIAKTGN